MQKVKVDSGQPLFSSSAIDTGEFLLQLGNFWKNLDWPEPIDSVGQLCSVIEVKGLLWNATSQCFDCRCTSMTRNI